MNDIEINLKNWMLKNYVICTDIVKGIETIQRKKVYVENCVNSFIENVEGLEGLEYSKDNIINSFLPK